MNMNCNYLTTIFRSILTKIYEFLVIFTILHFDLEKVISKNCKYIFFYQKFAHLGEKASKNCSQMIVVHVYVLISSPGVTILQTVSNQEVILKD